MKDGPGASPLPIAFLGLTIATTLYAGFETRLVPHADFHTLGWIVLAAAVPLQFLAAIWGLVRGELGAATGSSVLAGIWFAVALATLHTAPGAPGPSKVESLALFAAAAALVIPVTTELVEGKFAAAIVMATASCRFVLTGVSGVTHSLNWATAAGVAGFVLAVVAFAGAFFIELRNALNRR